MKDVENRGVRSARSKLFHRFVETANFPIPAVDIDRNVLAVIAVCQLVGYLTVVDSPSRARYFERLFLSR